jgi:hypothetical protein
MVAHFSGTTIRERNVRLARLLPDWWGSFIQHLACKTRNSEDEKKEK